jgi:integrase
VLVRRGPKEEGLVFGARNFDHFRSAWERALTRAKLADFRWHDLRHTYASWLVQKRVTLLEVKDLLGHASLSMTKRYSHLAPEHLRQATASLDGVLGWMGCWACPCQRKFSARSSRILSRVSRCLRSPCRKW